MTSVRVYRSALVALTLLMPITLGAQEIVEAASGLCEKVRTCAMAQIDKEDLTPELRQMMEPMLDSMCANMQSKVQEVKVGNALHQPAVDCMRSMQALSCEDMQDPARMQTAQCESYEKLAREAQDKS